MTAYKDITVDIEGHVQVVTIRRPPFNFFDNDLIRQLASAFEAGDRDADVRASVLCSEGKAFCAGADFANRADTGTVDCGEDGICELVVTGLTISNVNPSTPHTISAVGGPGRIAVVDEHMADGCCPDAAATATLSLRTGTITPDYALTNDVCDCFTGLTLSYTLESVPSGTWTIAHGGASTSVTVP